ncbi:MAG: PHP domain-containing protein [Planctomycetes bacterium]|nr:PHP domain-containing protein [Planctomycetota bacterium]
MHLKQVTPMVTAGAGLAVLLASSAALPLDPEKSVSITEKIFHLGNGDKPDWAKFTTTKPSHRASIQFSFRGQPNDQAATLELLGGEVADGWKVRLNDKEIGELKKSAGPERQYLEVPARLIKAGGNELAIECKNPKTDDDIYVGRIALHSLALKELAASARVKVEVREARTGESLPCRLTITRAAELAIKGEPEEVLAEFTAEKNKQWAARRGIFYTMDGKAEFKLAPGKYLLYATRGFEYGLARAALDLHPKSREAVKLTIEREVDTTGWLAADTHIHTRTYSGHGDATVEERVVTIAGEGVEIAVATDHDHHTDYQPAAREVGVAERFFSIVGNEFTTAIGHFNAFPIDPDAKPAKHDHKDWVKLLQGLRASPGVRVVIINHPRRPNFTDSPFGQIGLNPVSGEVHHGPDGLGIDAVEVLNGRTLASNRMLTFEDWFALINRGQRLAAVAGSDSHTVDGIVGQTRTYVKCSTDDPRKADLLEVCDSFLKGRLLVSLGLLADVKVNGRYGVGDLVSDHQDALEVEITVSGPRWTRADEVSLHLNGRQVRKEAIRPTRGASKNDLVKFHGVWKIPAPPRDAFLVVLASGPPVTAPYWALWQKNKYLCGATNPVWIDGDRDGRFTSAHEYASELVKQHGGDPAALHRALEGYDESVAVQVASISRRQMLAALQAEYERLREKYTQQLAAALATGGLKKESPILKYLENSPPIDIITSFARWEKELEEKVKKLESQAEKEAATKKVEEDPEDRVDREEKEEELRKKEDL